MTALHLMITGGTGYVGSRLVSRVRRKGHRVTLLSRRPNMPGDDPFVRYFQWTLDEPPPLRAFAEDDGFGGVDTLIHLAHAWDGDGPEEKDKNLLGMEKLLIKAREQNVGRIVFCSSASARKDALNQYGRVKWACEQLLNPPSEVAARVGLVYGGQAHGGQAGGQWETLCKMIRSLPVLPVPCAGAPVQPIHVDDVCAGLLALAEAPGLDKPVYGLASVDPVPFGRFLKLVARNLYGRRLIVIPVPAGLALLGARVTGLLPFVPTVDEERILGVAGIQTIETAADMAELGLAPRPLAESLMSEASPAKD